VWAVPMPRDGPRRTPRTTLRRDFREYRACRPRRDQEVRGRLRGHLRQVEGPGGQRGRAGRGGREEGRGRQKDRDREKSQGRGGRKEGRGKGKARPKKGARQEGHEEEVTAPSCRRHRARGGGAPPSRALAFHGPARLRTTCPAHFGCTLRSTL